MNINETLEGLQCCYIKEDCTYCPYLFKFEQYECWGRMIDDVKMYLENYKNFLQKENPI